MATYLIQNGVNKRGTTWVNQNDHNTGSYAGTSATIAWNQSSKLKITMYVNYYLSNLSGWNSAIDASEYAYLYVTCYTDSLNEGYGNARLQITKYGNDDDTGISQAITSTSTQYKISLSSLSSAYKASLQTYLYFRDFRNAAVAPMNRSAYIKDMWLTKNYTITYNANGGSGAPAAQTLEEGTRTLSSTTPTRSGYSFLGWSTSSSATTATYGAGATINLTANITLYAVWKAELSTVSTGNGTLDTSQNITITQQGTSYSYKHTLRYSLTGNNGTATGTIASNITGSNQTITQAWTPPAGIANYVTNAKTCSCTISCDTYSGSTLLGTKSCSITLTIPNTAEYAPSFTSYTIQRKDGTFPSEFAAWVQNKTRPEFIGTVSVKHNATVVSWKYTVNGATTTVTSTDTSKTYTGAAISQSGNQTVTMVVTDSRGYTVSHSATVSVSAYSAPTIYSLTMTRCLSDGTINAQGEYLYTDGTIQWSDLNGTNPLLYSIDYKQTTTWVTDETGEVGANTFPTHSSSNIVNESLSYETRVVLTDFYGTYVFSSTVSTALSIIDIKANGLGVAFGKVHTEADKTVEIAPDWDIVKGGVKYQPFVVDHVDIDDVEVAIGSYQSFTISTAKTGYTPIGIVQWYLNNATNGGQYNTYCFTIRLYLNSSNNVYWLVRNMADYVAKIKARAYILYVKD